MLLKVFAIVCANTVSKAQIEANTVLPSPVLQTSVISFMYADASQVMPSRVKLKPCSQGESLSVYMHGLHVQHSD